MKSIQVVWTDNPLQYWYQSDLYKAGVELPPDTRHLVSKETVQQYETISIELDPCHGSFIQVFEFILHAFTIKK